MRSIIVFLVRGVVNFLLKRRSWRLAFNKVLLAGLAGLSALLLLGQANIYAQGKITVWTKDGMPIDGYTAIQFDKGDILYLDSITPSNDPNFVPMSPASVMSRDATYYVKVGQYREQRDGDPVYYYEYKPFENFYKLGLDKYFPSISTVAEPINITSILTQALTDDTGKGYDIWPFYIKSLDCLTEDSILQMRLAGRNPENDGVIREDLSNVKWVTLEMGYKISSQLLKFNAAIIKPRQSTISFEHVIFANGLYLGGSGGGGAFALPDIDGEYVDRNKNNGDLPRVETIISGNVAFFNNTSMVGGGALYTEYPLRFMGDVYFVGNKSLYGMVASDGIWAFNSSARLNGGGGMSLYNSSLDIVNSLAFDKAAYFIGNMTSDKGGGLFVGKTIEVTFGGKAVFIGNAAGLHSLFPTSNAGVATPWAFGSGGGLLLNEDSIARFKSESIFIGNVSLGAGGGIGSSSRGSHAHFSAKAIFTDNRAGMEEHQVTVAAPEANAGTVVTLYGKPADGGGMFAGSGAEFFNGSTRVDAVFQRNWAVGGGGGIGTTNWDNSNHGGNNIGTNLALRFSGDTTFENNVAGSQGGAIATGNVAMGQSGAGWYSRAGAYFDGSFHGRMLMQGNIAYSPTPILSGTGYFNYVSGGNPYAKSDIQPDTYVLPMIGGGAIMAASGLTIHQIHAFVGNQAGGSGGAIMVGTAANRSSTPRITITGTTSVDVGSKATIDINPLDWETPGSYERGGGYALFKDNLALRNGGAISAWAGASPVTAYIGSGVTFTGNAAAGLGGAIIMGDGIYQSTGSFQTGTTSSIGALTLAARVDDIIFTGNRMGVAVDESTFDRDSILDPSGTSVGGYLTPDMSTGQANDIYIGGPGISGTTATINMNAYEGMKIYFDGGIMAASQVLLTLNVNNTTDAATHSNAAWSNTRLSNTAPVGTILLDEASLDAYANTTVNNGVLRIQGTSQDLHWGYADSVARNTTKFILTGTAALEANATIYSGSIVIGNANDNNTTLRVLGDLDTGAGGMLTLAGGTVSYRGRVNFAGNGRINSGATAFTGTTIASIAIGDSGHRVGQTLVLAKDNSVGASAELSRSRLVVGLFGGTDSDRFAASDITVTGTNTISLITGASGTYSIAQAAYAAIATGGTTAPVFLIDFKGTRLDNAATNPRMSVSSTIDGNNIVLSYVTDNKVLAWSATSVATWNLTGSYWNDNGPSDVSYVLGDAVQFLRANSGTVTVGQNILVSGIYVDGDYEFRGVNGITTDSISWGGSVAPAEASGRLVKTGTDTKLVFANTGSNEFIGGIEIASGTIQMSTLGHLGTSLDKLMFTGTNLSDYATLLLTGTLVLDAAQSTGSQRLALDDNKVGTVRITTGGGLVITNNQSASGVNGGAVYAGAGSILNLDAEDGDISFKNNTADLGGAFYLDDATLNIGVGTNNRITVGLARDEELNTLANTSGKDSIYGTAASVINKSGSGVLAINSDSSRFEGTINVEMGSLLLGAGSKLGGTINVSGSDTELGGAAIFAGDVNMGTDSVLRVGSPVKQDLPETIEIGGALLLDGARLKFNGYTDVDGKFSTDVIKATNVTMTGSIKFDFATLQTGSGVVLASSNEIDWDVSGGSQYLIYKEDKLVNKERIGASIDYGQNYVVTGSVFVSTTIVVLGSSTVSEGWVLTGTTVADKTKLVLTSGVINYRATWTGESGQVNSQGYAVWNDTYLHGNWALAQSSVADETAFLNGDSVVFDSVSDGAHTNMRTIWVDRERLVADMTLTGSGVYRFLGGEIKTNVGDGNLRGVDASGTKIIDLSTGQLLLDENFTGILILNNAGNSFSGRVQEDGTLTDGIVIQNGTLEARVESITGNVITNNSLLVLNETSTDPKDTAFKGAISGGGDLAKTGVGRVSIDGSAYLFARNIDVRQGVFVINSTDSVEVGDTIYIQASGTLKLPGYALKASNVVNMGALMRYDTGSTIINIPESTDPDARITKILGNYYSDAGVIVLYTNPGMVYADSIRVDGNSAGTGILQMRISGTDVTKSAPPPKRDTLIFSTVGTGRDIHLTMDWMNSQLENVTTGEVFDYADNYVLLQGKDKNWYLRNLTVAPDREQLPFIAASPAIADLLQKAQVRSLYLHTNARHDDIRKNGMIWTDYMHNEDRLRDAFYDETMLKADIFQVGVDYAIVPKSERTRLQLSAGLSYAFASAKATRADASTIDIDGQYVNGYLSARYGISYLHLVGSFSPDMRYKVKTTYGLDANGEVEASSTSISMELGMITAPLGGGQLEHYVQIIGQKHSFGMISTTSDYYEFNDGSSANRRDYSFKNPTTLRGMGGLRWGSHLQLRNNPNWAFRPWGGVAYGRNMSNDYIITAGGHEVRYDNRGNFYSFTGGLTAVWRRQLQAHFTLEWSSGRPMNSYTLNTGINYLW